MLKEILINNKKSILKCWFNKILDTYPSDSFKLFSRTKDQFANPVGFTINEGIEELYEELLNEMDQEKICSTLEKVIKIRAIQDFPPSQAVGIILFLKEAINEELKEESIDRNLQKEVQSFFSRIDVMVLIAFDIYMTCINQINEIRVDGIKRRTSRFLKENDIIKEIDE